MKKLIIFLALFLLSSSAWATAITLTTTGNNWLDPSNTTTNNSTNTTLNSVGRQANQAFTFHFSYSGLGSSVSRAFLYFYESSRSSNHNLTISRILQNELPSQSTWNSFSTGNNWATAGALSSGVDYTTTNQVTVGNNNGGWVSADVTSLVNDMLANNNYGFIVRSVNTNDGDQIVGLSNGTNVPILYVTYSGIPTNYCTDASIVSCYTIQEGSGTTLIDHSANGYNGTFASAGHPAWTVAAPSRAYLANSLTYSTTSDFLTLGTSHIAFKPGQAQSIVVWVFPTTNSSGGGNPVIISNNGSSGTSAWTLPATTSLDWTPAGTTSLVTQTSNGSYSLNTWNHFGVSWDGSTNSFSPSTIEYINGLQASSYQANTNGVGLFNNQTGQLNLGNRSSDEARNISGKLTEFAEFSRQLNPAEFYDIFVNGLGVYTTSTVTTSVNNGKIFNASIY